MKQRLQLVGFLIAFCAIATVVSLWDDEPEWEGRRVSEWIVELQPYFFWMGRDLERDDWEDRFEELLNRRRMAKEAIRSIGPVVIPDLLRLLDGEKPDGIAKLWMDLLNTSTGRQPDGYDRSLGFERAAEGFAALGPEGASAIPILEAMLSVKAQRLYAIYCLVGIGKDSTPVFVTELRHTDPERRIAALLGLWKLGTNAPNTLAAVRSSLSDPEIDVRRWAAMASIAIETNQFENLHTLNQVIGDSTPNFGVSPGAFREYVKRHPSPEAELEPILTKLLKFVASTNPPIAEASLRAISILGVAPESGKDTIIRATTSESSAVRRAACMALGGTTENDLPVLSLLADMVRTDSDVDVRESAVRALAKHGEVALKIAPDLDSEIRKNFEMQRRRNVIESRSSVP